MLKEWISRSLNRINRRNAKLLFSLHIHKDKNLSIQDKEFCKKAIQFGRVDEKYSRDKKICFKTYDKSEKVTILVITEILKDSIKIITYFKKKGKH